MDIKRAYAFLGKDWERTSSLIREAVATDIPLLQNTNEGILNHGGKMLRPVLSLLVSRVCGLEEGSEDAARCAAASELLHNATLLHDDVADASALRRGQPTTAATLGNAASVLIGDFWLAKAVMVIMGLEKCRGEVVSVFSKTMSDLAEGEVFQMEKAGLADTSEEDYYRIIYCKTASLFEAACVSSALVAGAGPDERKAVKEFAKNLGMAFQVRDDILDYVGSDALGKPRGEDLSEKKITLPLLGALHNVSPAREKEVRESLLHIDENPSIKGQIVSFVDENGGVEYAQTRLREIVETSGKALSVFPDNPARSVLLDIENYMIDRVK